MNELRQQENSNEQLFLEEISTLLYPQGNSQFEKDCFEVFYSKEYEGKKRAELLFLLNRKKSINGTIPSVERVSQLKKDQAKKIKETFEAEMKADIEEDFNSIQGNGKGHPRKGKAPHEIAFNWLWNYKYPRGLVDRELQYLIGAADKHSDWINFIPINESNKGINGHRRPQPSQPTINLETSSFMSINLPKSEGYFLLLNRGFVTRVFLCPSGDFAPTNKVDGEEMLIPQKDARNEDLFFDKIGQEEFIGIWADQDLNLPWVEEESLPSCTPKRINNLLAELKLSQYQVFYKSFEVVEH